MIKRKTIGNRDAVEANEELCDLREVLGKKGERYSFRCIELGLELMSHGDCYLLSQFLVTLHLI